MKGSNPFGEVKRGHIKLQAPLTHLFLIEQEEESYRGVPYERNPRVRTQWGDAKGEYSRFDHFHFGEATTKDSMALVRSLKDTELFALVLAKLSSKVVPNNPDAYRCLIVCPTGHNVLEMRRLGFIDLDCESLGSALDSLAERPVITLI